MITVFSLSLPWESGADIPSEYTCGPSGVNWQTQPNPLVSWSGAPDGTAAFALIYVDSDLNDWEHWAFYTADASVLSIPASSSNTTSWRASRALKRPISTQSRMGCLGAPRNAATVASRPSTATSPSRS